MTSSRGVVRLQDLPKAGPTAWLNALAAAGVFTVLGVTMPALLESGLPTVAVVLWGVICLGLGVGNLWSLDRRLREVRA